MERLRGIMKIKDIAQKCNNGFTSMIVGHPKAITVIFTMATVICGVLSLGVKVNFDNAAYLPAGMNSVRAINVLSEEFGMNGSALLLLKGKSIPAVREIKEKISETAGVKEAVWLDDYTDVNVPVEFMDSGYIDAFYKDGNALITVLFEKGDSDPATFEALNKIKAITGTDGRISGPAAIARNTLQRTNSEIPVYMSIAVVLILIILFLTTSSWIEPMIFLAAIGSAIIMNNGTNIIKGEVSQVTFAAASLLQLAVSMDYSIFLLHRFHEERGKSVELKQAIINSIRLSFRPIAASGITTLVGFTALMFMDFGIGKDMGLVLAKGIVFSLVSVLVFLPSLVLVFSRLIEKYTHKELKLEFKKLSKASVKLRCPVAALMVVVSLLSFLAQSRIDYYYGKEKMLPDNDEAIAAAREIESVYGGLNRNTLLVPKGDKAKEAAMISELEALDYVRDVKALCKQLGTEIPEMMVEDRLLKKTQSDGYSLITFNIGCGKETPQSYDTAEKIKSIAKRYYDTWYISGETFTYKDLNDVTRSDFTRVNTLSAIFIFLILAITFKSLLVPLIAVFTIELGIWANIGYAYFAGSPMSFIAVIVIGAIQLGATVDYAILYISRYRENLPGSNPVSAAAKTFMDTAKSIITSGSIVVAATLSVYYAASIRTASEICLLIGRGALISMFCVLFVLPGFLILSSKTLENKVKAYKEET